FAIFLALILVEILLLGGQGWSHALMSFMREAVLGFIIGFAGGQSSLSFSIGWRWRRDCMRHLWQSARLLSSLSPMRCMRRDFWPFILPAWWSATIRHGRIILSSYSSMPSRGFRKS